MPSCYREMKHCVHGLRLYFAIKSRLRDSEIYKQAV